MSVKGKCNCGKPATCEYLVRNKKNAWTIKLCKDCKPKYHNAKITLIDGK